MTIDLPPRLLEWVRERAGLTKETLGEKLGVSVEKVVAWERDGRITPRQAEKLAGVTHTAFGYLFLAEPPDERLPIPDLRTEGSVAAGRPSPDLLETEDMANDPRSCLLQSKRVGPSRAPGLFHALDTLLTLS